MSQISDEQAQKWLNVASATAKIHTDIMFVVPKDGAMRALRLVSTIDWCGRWLVLTCNHILKNDHVYFTSPMRLKQDIVDESSRYEAQSLRLLSATADLDLAIFDGTNIDHHASSKVSYLLADSAWLAPNKLDTNEGVSVFIYGLLGNKARGHQYPDGLLYLQAPIYAGLGPLVGVAEHEVVVDMAEKQIVTLNDKDFPQLKGEVATGGVRDLHGSSGSGMWMSLDKKTCLLGIVLGRKPSPPGTHLVRATPVWSVQRWLERVFATK